MVSGLLIVEVGNLLFLSIIVEICNGNVGGTIYRGSSLISDESM